MPESAERDWIKNLVQGQGEVLVGGSVNYADHASFGYESYDGQYMVTVTRGGVSPSVPESAPKQKDEAATVTAPASPADDPKPVTPPPAAAAPAVKADVSAEPVSTPKPEKPEKQQTVDAEKQQTVDTAPSASAQAGDSSSKPDPAVDSKLGTRASRAQRKTE